VFTSHRRAMDLAATALSKTERATLIELLRKLGTSAELQPRKTVDPVKQTGKETAHA
jgi:uncharacterized protein (DUF305 family)